MQHDALRDLADRYVRDASFRTALRHDAASAVREAGLELSSSELAVVQSTDWSRTEARYRTRIVVADAR